MPSCCGLCMTRSACTENLSSEQYLSGMQTSQTQKHGRPESQPNHLRLLPRLLGRGLGGIYSFRYLETSSQWDIYRKPCKGLTKLKKARDFFLNYLFKIGSRER